MRRTYLTLSEEDKDYLKTLSKKRTIQAQIVDRAKILLYKSDGMTFNAIAEKLAISSATVRLCVSKYYEGGIEKALFDTQRPGRPSEITDDAKAWENDNNPESNYPKMCLRESRVLQKIRTLRNYRMIWY